jgi:hypothetical protein
MPSTPALHVARSAHDASALPRDAVARRRVTSTVSPIAGTWVSFPLLAALLALAVALGSHGVLSDADTYWHIAVGRWIAAHHAIPTVDPFSHSAPGLPWTAHEWGSELLLSSVFALGGWQGVQMLTAIAFALTVAYITRFLLDRMPPTQALVFAALCGTLMMTHLLARPHVLVWPLMAVWVGSLVAAGERKTAPPWWPLLLMPLWANLHASFTLGIGFACVLAADAVMQHDATADRIAGARRWALFLAAAILATLITPHGIAAYANALRVMRMKETLLLVNEWQSANFQQFQPMLLWLLAILALGLSGRLRLSFFRLCFVCGLLYLALKHQRYHSLLGIVSPMLLATPIAVGMRARMPSTANDAELLDRWFALLARPLRAGGLAVAIALGAIVSTVVSRALPAHENAAVTPAAALDAFSLLHVQGKVLNGYALGGYLIYRGVPVFMDGRGDMYGDAMMVEASDALSLKKSGVLEALLGKYQIGWTLLNPNTAAVALLDRLPEWQRIYGDSIAVVHVKRALLSPSRRDGAR